MKRTKPFKRPSVFADAYPGPPYQPLEEPLDRTLRGLRSHIEQLERRVAQLEVRERGRVYSVPGVASRNLADELVD